MRITLSGVSFDQVHRIMAGQKESQNQNQNQQH